jgi:basic membrane lipoprotein Med (substrate-binding protein (PBP1-ABC) superfamily)/DNA-binding SARP family transcriptional activator
MQYRLLGTLEVTDESGRALDLGPFKQRSLFALLLLNAGQTVSTDRILEALWGEEADGKQNALWVYISRLRSALEPERSERGESTILVRRDPGYLLDIDTGQVDVHRFESGLEKARGIVGDDPEAAVALLDDSLALWRGSALEEFTYEDFARIEIERLDELRLEAIETRLDAKLALGETRSLISELESLVREHPFRERPAGQLMVSLYRSGRQAEALRAYERHRRTVTEELGIEPSPDLRRLEERILLHDPALLPHGLEQADISGRPDHAPFKGLLAFDEDDEANFFGRDELVAEVLRRVESDRLIAVVGPSGSGKSSVVTAGVLPRIRKGAVAGSDRWLIARMVPGGHPFIELEAALLRSSLDAPDTLAAQLADGDSGILRAALRILPTPESRLLLIIDQFEELFTLVDDPAVQRHFLSGLLTALDDTRGRIAVILTLRADFYDRPLLHPEFGARIGPAVVNVTPLSAAELEEAAVRPAENAGIRLEPALLGQIIADVVDQPGALPMFQYTLTELYERRTDNVLRLKDYTAMGGVRGAITNRAESIYAELDSEAQEAARQLFLRLVALTGGDSWSRRRVPASEIISLDVDVVSLQSAISALGEKRLLSFDRHRATGEPTVEVGHEALLTEWERLGGWITEARKDLERHAALVVSVDEWERSGRAADYLLSGTRLAEYEKWSATSHIQLNVRELDYIGAGVARRSEELELETSRQSQERRLEGSARRRFWGLVAALAVLLAVAAVWVAFTYVLTGPTVVVVYEGDEGGNTVGGLIATGVERAVGQERFELVEVVPPVTDIEARIIELIEDGAEIVVGIGLLHSALVNHLAREYPDVQVVAIDGLAAGPNVATYTFAVEEGAYLAGVAAALTTDTGRVGYLGGLQIDNVENFRAGFAQGVRSISNDITIEEIYVSSGDIELAFSRPDIGEGAAAELFANGADVVFHAAGGTGYGIHEAAKKATLETGRKHWGIGVDDDELLAVDASVRDYVLTSSLKRYDEAVTQAILDAVRGDAVYGANRVLGLKDGATSYSQTGDHLAPDVVDRLDAAAAQIAAGAIDIDPWPIEPPDRLFGTHRILDATVTIDHSGSCTYEGPLEAPTGSTVRLQITNHSSELAAVAVFSELGFGGNAVAQPQSSNSLHVGMAAFLGDIELLCGSMASRLDGTMSIAATLTASLIVDDDNADLLEEYLRANAEGSFEEARPLAVEGLPFERWGAPCPSDGCPTMEDKFVFDRALESELTTLACTASPGGATCEATGTDLIGKRIGWTWVYSYEATIEDGLITGIITRFNNPAFDRFVRWLERNHGSEFAVTCSVLQSEECTGFMVRMLPDWDG